MPALDQIASFRSLADYFRVFP